MINILYASGHVTVDYAAKELKKYLDMVTKTLGFAKIKKVDALPEKAGEGEILLVCVCATEAQAGWVKDRPAYKGVEICFRQEEE